MVKFIKKRDNREVPFDHSKIEYAVLKATKAVDRESENISKEITQSVLSYLNLFFKDGGIPSVELIQDLVEKILIEKGYSDIAKAYILYREQHAKLRDTKRLFDDALNVISTYLDRSNWKVNENSNMGFSLQGLNNHISSEVTSQYWLQEIYPQEIRNLHSSGDLHIHDLSNLSVYCCGWDLHDLLLTGFGGVATKVESKPPKHFRTALGQIVNFFYTLQGEAAGAQAFANFDTYLAPFIYYDNLSYREVKQSIQEFIYNMNVPTRVGFQTPFTNITMDLIPSNTIAQQPAIIGGKAKDKNLGEFQEEMNLINKAFAEVMLEGDAKGRVFSFPIPTYNITSDFDWDNPVYEPIWEMTAKYGIPYFSNFINSDMSPDDARSMCLFPEEDILIRQDNNIQKLTIGELFNEEKGKQLDNEWFDIKSPVEALSLNPKSGKLEWVGIQKMLRVVGQALVNIRTKDGKTMKVSPDHLVAVYTEDGIITKKAGEIDEDDFLLVMKDGSNILQDNQETVSKELAWFMGLFIADGNYLYDSRKRWRNRHRGIQISFNKLEKELIEKTKATIKNLLGYDMKFILDPRYENSLRGYIYNSEFSKKMEEEYDVRKYGRLPKWIWSSSADIISSFIKGFFDGDGYTDGKEIHINDQGLAEELNLLFQLIGISTSYVVKDNSQVIRIQHVLGRGAKGSKIIKDKMHNLIPEFLVDQKYIRSEEGKMLYQPYGCKTVGLSSIDRWDISNESIEWLRNSDFTVVEVAEIITSDLDYNQEFFDIELEKNHYFVHSQGNITHNCCRLRLDNRELRKRGGGLFGANPMTGSIGVVTINLPRIGYISKDKNEFLQRIEKLMEKAKESLELKRKVLERFTETGLYPYSQHYLRDIKKRFDNYWQNHFNTIGINGMNEALINFMDQDIGSQEGLAFAMEIMDFMRAKMVDFQEETDNMYNLEATPAEGTSYRFAKLDKEKFNDAIIAANENRVKSDNADPYYTNSTHLPVGYTDDIFTALEMQDELQSRYTGGTVLHGFIGEKLPSKESTKILVKRIAENFKLPYYTITPSFSVCPIHGYLSGEHEYCPKCDAENSFLK